MADFRKFPHHLPHPAHPLQTQSLPKGMNVTTASLPLLRYIRFDNRSKKRYFFLQILVFIFQCLNEFFCGLLVFNMQIFNVTIPVSPLHYWFGFEWLFLKYLIVRSYPYLNPNSAKSGSCFTKNTLNIRALYKIYKQPK